MTLDFLVALATAKVLGELIFYILGVGFWYLIYKEIYLK